MDFLLQISENNINKMTLNSILIHAKRSLIDDMIYIYLKNTQLMP